MRLGFAYQIRREMLRDVIVRGAGHAEFIRSVINHRFKTSEVVMRRRRRNGPFKRGRMPRIFFLRFLPCLQTPEKVEQENQLRSDCDERRNTNENVDRLKLREVRHCGGIKIAPRMPRQSKEVHRHKDRIDTDEREPEMDLPNPFVQETPKHFWKPEIHAREHS